MWKNSLSPARRSPWRRRRAGRRRRGRLHGDLRAGDTLFFHTSHRLDDVELAALGARLRRRDRRSTTGRCVGPETLWRIVAAEERDRVRHQPALPAAVRGRGYSPRRARSTSARCARCSPPARSCTTGSTTGSPRTSGRCRCSRSPAAPTSSAASSSATQTCRSAAGWSQCRSLGLDVQALATTATRRTRRSASWSAATRSPPGRSASSATTTAPLPRRVLRRRTPASGPTAT